MSTYETERARTDTQPTAVVRTWNGSDVSWGPMPLDKAIKFAADDHHAHRYVEVAGRIVFDWDAFIADVATQVPA